jgi:DNA-binding Xre family transcriptional regulator
MGASYNKLFKLLIDKNMKKGELCVRAGISGASLAKIAKGDNVNADILVRICQALQCNIGDIMDVIIEAEPHGSH